jgi:hypothetical protein
MRRESRPCREAHHRADEQIQLHRVFRPRNPETTEPKEDNMMKRLLLWIAQGLAGLVLIAFFCLMLIEWAAGCGESYVDAKGKTHINDCVFINQSQGVSKP